MLRNYSEPGMSWMSKLAEKKKTPRKTQKNSSHLKNKRIINMKMPAKGGPIFTFSLPGGRLAPLSSPSTTPVSPRTCNKAA